MKEQIERLLRESLDKKLRSPRAQPRQAFVRPVTVYIGRDPGELLRAFSQDLSQEGIGLITDVAWEAGRVATLEIHSLFGPPVRLRAEVRWCEPFGTGWYISGWHFLSS